MTIRSAPPSAQSAELDRRSSSNPAALADERNLALAGTLEN